MCNFNKQNSDTKALIHLFMKKSADTLGGANFLLNLLETMKAKRPSALILKELYLRANACIKSSPKVV